MAPATGALTVVEDFDDAAARDATRTTASWSVREQALLLALRRARVGALDPATVVTTDLGATAADSRAVAIGDVDGDGDLDVVVGNHGAASQLYLNNGTTAPFVGVTGIDIAADSTATRALALGDLDGDGDVDLVTGNDGQPNRLYLNDGTATAFAGVTGIAVTGDSHATRAIALADMDADGDLDLIVANAGQPNRLYLNHGGAAPFDGVTGSDISADAHASTALAVGDLDQDGALDLVVGNDGQAIRLYLGNAGADPFAGVSGTDVSSDTGAARAVVLGDVDGDGDLDLVVGNDGQPVRLYLSVGGGDPFAGVVGSDVSADTRATRGLALVDVDGDGDLDLLASGDMVTTRLYRNAGNGDPFGGVAGIDVTVDARPTQAIAAGDLDGDGDLDLVTASSGALGQIHLDAGTAVPFAGVAASDIASDTGDVRAVAVGDVDGDGDLDLVAGRFGATNRLYLNNGTSAPFAGVAGADVTADTDQTQAVALGDVDGDGHLDLVVGNLGQPNRLYLNNGTATPFAAVAGVDITADAHATLAVALGDLDGDGDLDLVVGNLGQPNRLYLNAGSATPFAAVTGTDIGTDSDATQAIAVADVDGDGDLDVVAGNDGAPNRWYANDGSATPFAGVGGADVTTDAQATLAIVLGDVDGDGHLDLVAGNAGQPSRLYLGNGTATPFVGVAGIDVGTGTDITLSLAMADVDADGDLDLAVGNLGQPNRLYLNDGGGFASVSALDVGAETDSTRTIVLADLDHDGDVDLVSGNDGTPHRLYANARAPSPLAALTGAALGAGADDTLAVAVGDVDGDGDLDIVVGNSGQPNRLYLNRGGREPFAGVAGVDITADAHPTAAVALADLDGDGDLDLVVGNDGARNRLYLNNGSADPFAGVTGTDVGSVTFATLSIAVGDVDGDGDLDLVAGNYGARNRLYLNNGGTAPFAGVAGVDITTDALLTSAVALADLDGDGHLDLVAAHILAPPRVYLSNGTASPFAGVVGDDVSTDTPLTLALAVGDVDGDGHLDLVLGNAGANRLYLNGGGPDPFASVVGTDVDSDATVTFALALADLDADGDLDVATGNFAFAGGTETNRFYPNNGTATPFAGVAGVDITSDSRFTSALAVGDLDRDGLVDLVVGNNGDGNQIHLRRLHDTVAGVATSLDVGAAVGRIGRITLDPTVTMPAHTTVEWQVSANGGARWHQVRPGIALDIAPSAQGSDLRWRARLGSSSPPHSPAVSALSVEVELDTDGDGELDATDIDDDGDGIPDTQDAFPLDPAASVDTDGDGRPDDYNPGSTAEQRAASPLVVDDDDDGDGVVDTADNCPLTSNASQLDRDADGIGDACDPRDDSETCFAVPLAGGRATVLCI
ncbi:MAG: VCBS repeat-containing protein [Chromatiales bacterium]|nr:VCBS repeat-containing protein [Chromatiales bacterium]